MARVVRSRPSLNLGVFAETYPFWTLAIFLVAVFVFGGSSRADAPTLIALWPLTAIALAIGLFRLRDPETARLRGVLLVALVPLALVLLHLVPLPPAIWTALPGRELATQAAVIAGIEQPWRPLALVPWRGWNTAFSLLVPLAVLLLALGCRPDQRRWLLFVLLGLSGLSFALASLQIVAGFPAWLYVYPTNSEGSPTGLFANRNHLAAMLACCLPMLAVFALSGRDRTGASPRIWVALVAGFACLTMLLLTGSRGGVFLGIAAVLGVALIAWRDTRQQAGMNRLWLILGAGGLVLALAGILGLAFARADAIGELVQLDAADEPRYAIWAPIWTMVWQYFPVGSGAGSFVETYKMGEPHDLLGPLYFNHAHNDWLEVMLEFGLPGLVLLAAAVFLWARRSIGVFRRAIGDPVQLRLARAGSVMIFLLGLASIVDYPLRVPTMACVFAIATVWIASAARHRPTASKQFEAAVVDQGRNN